MSTAKLCTIGCGRPADGWSPIDLHYHTNEHEAEWCNTCSRMISHMSPLYRPRRIAAMLTKNQQRRAQTETAWRLGASSEAMNEILLLDADVGAA